MSLAAFFDVLHFLRPQWLWALAAVPPFALAWRRRMADRDPWRGRVDAHLLAQLQVAAPRQLWRAWAMPVLASLAFALLVLALAGPSWQRSAQPLRDARSPLVVALDLSGSITAADLPPSRLAQARAALAELLARHQGGDVGMLAYAGDAYVVSPLTSDAANVALFLDALSPGIMPGEVDAPARPERAIAMAADLMRQAGDSRGDILLLAGTAGAGAADAARGAAAAGYRVSVLGLGTQAGAPWRDAGGAIHHAALDAAALRALAAAGDGRYAALAQPGALDALDLWAARAGEGRVARRAGALAWRDQGYWLLLPLMLLVAFAFRRGGALGLLALCLVLPWPAARAAGPGDLWQRPDQQAHARMVHGAQAYRSQDYATALRAWEGLPGADAAYNRGNALARQGRFNEALDAYDRALALQPGMADARANRQTVLEAMRQPPPQDGEQHQQDAREGDTGGTPEQKPTPPASADPRQQAQADAAQRERMRQALQQGKPRKAGGEGAQAQSPGASESAREREQRLANEAWLRRVPDDPGGLLRARFQLEYQRRRGQQP